MCFLPLGQQNGRSCLASLAVRSCFCLLSILQETHFFQSRLLFLTIDTYFVGISSVLNAYFLDTGVHISL
jgi:hypothetical protein